MPISLELARHHIEQWSKHDHLKHGRNFWPKYLYHSCSIETVAKILSDGSVICRSSVPEIICDVANQGALNNKPEAHNYVRMYFRPQNSFHYRTEGIKSLADPYRQHEHMAVPVCFMFDFIELMTNSNARFTKGNYAKTEEVLLCGDDSFLELDFENIYHNRPIDQHDDKDYILNCRMAEVVVKAEVPRDLIRHVVCRNDVEKRFLDHCIELKGMCPEIVRIDKKKSIFMYKSIILEKLYLDEGTLHFSFCPPYHGVKNKYKFEIFSEKQSYSGELEARSWYMSSLDFSDQSTIWTVKIEDCIAYNGVIPTFSKVA